MHTAYESTNVLKLHAQIEAVASYEDKLLVGTRQGHLMMYSIAPKPTDTKSYEVQLLRYNKNFSKKPIQQLAVVPEYDIIIKLSDNTITLHELSGINFAIHKIMNKTKGATYFALNVKRHVSLTGETVATVRMCVVVKRKLQLYYLKNREFHDFAADLTVSDVPRVISWSEETICIGFKGTYSMIKASAADPKESSVLVEVPLFPTGKHLEPSVTNINENIFSLVKDTHSVFMKTTGEAATNMAIKWTDVPCSVAYDEPYLIALLKDTLEVQCWSVEHNTVIQKIPVEGGKLVSQPRQGLIYVASVDNIWVLQSVTIAKQIKILLGDKRFELALKLANISDDSEEEKRNNIYQIQTLYAFDLFQNKKYDKAMQEFLKLDTDPYEVIRLFPSLLPQQMRDACFGESSDKMVDKDLENGLSALITYLTEVRRKIFQKKEAEIQSKSTQQLIQIIDTTLLKCYLQTNDALAAPLLRRNYCNLGEAEKTLKRYHKYSELVILYQTKGLHQKALDLLQREANQPESDLRGHELTVQYLQNLGKDHIDLIFQFAGWVLDAHPEDGLKIFTDDVPEVEHLPRPKVLDFLLKAQKHSVVIPYLEHVVHVWKDTNSIFHNALIHEYREKIKQAGNESSVQHLRTKLLNFLKKSDYYSPETVLIHFPGDSLFEERAIINGKLGRHEHALSIYVILMSDYQRAIEYCDQVYKNTGNGFVYVQLLRLLISPPDTLPGIRKPVTASPDLETALMLLEGHADRIPPIEALKELPDSVSVARVQHFLTASIQAQLDSRRKKQLLKALMYTELLQVEEERMQHQAKSILMTECNICPVCKKRFGNQSAFVRYPNGDIVHYSCQDIYNSKNV